MLLIVGLIACTSYDKTESEDPEATVIEKPLSEVERDDLDAEDYTSFKSTSEEEIRKNEDFISKLKEKMQAQKTDRQEEYKRRVDSLEVRNDELRSKLLQYRHSTKEEWEAFKREFKNDIEGLGRALENFADDNTN